MAPCGRREAKAMSTTPSPTPAPTSTPADTANQPATLTADAVGFKPAGFAPGVVAQAKADVALWNAEDALDRRDSDHAAQVLKSTLGNDFRDFVKVLDGYEKGLTESERERLYEPDTYNRLPLNDPQTAMKLVGRALDNIPILKKMVADGHTEKSAIEELMRQRGGPYFKGPFSAALQLKYRALMRA